MKRLAALTTLLCAGLVMSVTVSAATMPASSVRVAGGAASVTTCDPDGFTASSFTTSSRKVISVTVGGIAPACHGGALSVTLTQGSASVATGGPVTVTGTTQEVAVTGAPDAPAVTGLRAIVVGP